MESLEEQVITLLADGNVRRTREILTEMNAPDYIDLDRALRRMADAGVLRDVARSHRGPRRWALAAPAAP